MPHDRYEVLKAFCHAMEWAADPEAVYQRVVDVSSEYLECASAHLHLLDLDGKTFVKHASYIDRQVAGQLDMPIHQGVGRISELLESGKLIVMEDYTNPHADDVIPKLAVDMGFKSAISIPLSSTSGVLGMLTVVYREALPWSSDDREFLLELGGVLGTFIQRMQMSKKDVELQVLRERKQLSSEIHDNISQMVSALAIRADIAQSCLDDGDLAALAPELDALSSQARQVTKLLREEMLSLRAPIAESDDVVESVAEVLSRFGGQWNIETRLERATDTAILMPEHARLQLARIVNECLQNVLRHARASLVEVTVSRRNGRALIQVHDNGCGFNVDAVPPERLGIRIMRERAASAGGTLSVSSGSGGTTVLIEMPAARG